MSASLLALALAVSAPLVSAQTQRICYDRFGRAYTCNGLSNAARIGIGVAIAVVVVGLLALCGVMRRKQLQRNFSRYRPPTMPYAQNNGPGGPGGAAGGPGYSYGQGANPYANNPPPPPMGYQGQQASSWSTNQYGNGPQAPDATYQPGVSRTGGDGKLNGGAGGAENDHEHGYEWQQAREQERLEREQNQAMGGGPPGYDATVSTNQAPIVTGGSSRPAGNDTFAPPPGPPPGKS